jgi:molecular chaperone GrpE
MADDPSMNSGNEKDPEENGEPVIRDKRRIDPETGDVREPAADASAAATEEAGEDPAPSGEESLSDEDRALLEEAERDLVAEMRNDMLRAQAELVNFRTRVERDRVANREAVIAEVFRSLLPAIDDLARAEAHGDLVEGAPLTLVAQKLRTAFEKYGLKPVGEKGEPFDPAFHEAVVQLPSPDATENTIADVIEVGYVLGDRLVRPAKVAVSVPAE